MELHKASSREDSIPCLQPSQEHGGCRMKVEENCKRERVKWKRRREEWSGCVTDCLLDAYEDKWKSLDCGNSRRRHWEEVACHVSAQGRGRGRWDHGSKPPFQCSNKVDQMKKLKGERQRKSVLKWPHYSRLEFILQGSSQRDTSSQGYGIPGGTDAGHVFPPVLDQSSLSSEAGSLVPEESVEEEKWQVQDEEFDIEKEDDNSSDCPCKSSGLHIACWALYQKCQDLKALPPKTEESSSALPIRATPTSRQAFNLLQILF